MDQENQIQKEGQSQTDFLKDVSELEKSLSKIKSDMAFFVKKQREADSRNLQAKAAIDEIMKKYNKVLEDKEKNYQEEVNRRDKKIRQLLKKEKQGLIGNKRAKEIIGEITRHYNRLLKQKDKRLEEIKIVVNELRKNSEKKEAGLKEHEPKEDVVSNEFIGKNIPEKLIKSPKKELIEKIMGLLKENYGLNKKMMISFKEQTDKESQNLISQKSIEKKFTMLAKEYKYVLDKNKVLEEEMEKFQKNISILEEQMNKAKEIYEQRIKELKEQHKSELDGISSDRTESQISIEVGNEILKEEMEKLKQRLTEKELQKQEFAQEIELKVREAIQPLISQVFSKSTSTFTNDDKIDLNLFIEEAIIRGDTEDKIISDLVEKQGYEKSVVLAFIEKIRKQK
ncbi:hypothetical protein GOV08_02350 [Candidatus Woesearchaeota archaeon]|nr:hypothetical protein [Candidatus Woesearchaeota archaeon]